MMSGETDTNNLIASQNFGFWNNMAVTVLIAIIVTDHKSSLKICLLFLQLIGNSYVNVYEFHTDL